MTYDLWEEVEEVGHCAVLVHSEAKEKSRHQTHFTRKYRLACK